MEKKTPIRRPAVRETGISRGIMGAQLMPPYHARVFYRTEGFQGGPHDAERRQTRTKYLNHSSLTFSLRKKKKNLPSEKLASLVIMGEMKAPP